MNEAEKIDEGVVVLQEQKKKKIGVEEDGGWKQEEEGRAGCGVYMLGQAKQQQPKEEETGQEIEPPDSQLAK